MSKLAEEGGKFTPRRYVVAGYATIFIVFGVFGTWAATAPLASAVVAGGTVSVESNRKTIQHLEGGIVEKIAVEEGDLIKAGAVLVELDPTRAKGNYAVAKNRLALLQATEARLIAESTDVKEIEFPDTLLGSEDPIAGAAVRLQETLFQDRRNTKDNQIAILKVRVEQLNNVISGLDTQLEAVNEQIESIEAEVDRLKKGSVSGAIATNRVSQMTREMLQFESKKGELLADIGKFRQTISETELEILQVRQKYIERAREELRDAGDQLSEIYERFQLAADVLDRTVIRSPVRGIVQNIKVHTKDGVIQPAQPILEIIPLDDDLVVIAKISPVDIDNISVSQSAEVRFPAFSSKTTPTIWGKVMVISQDVVEPTNPNEQPYYQARIEVEDKDVPDEIRGNLLPGMPAEIVIPTGERTLAEYIAKPLTDSFHKSLREE